MRVGDIIHCGAIYVNDFKILESLSQEENFDIIVTRPMSDHFFKHDDFFVNNVRYYQEYKEKHSFEERIMLPERDKITYRKPFGLPITMPGKPGNYIVLQRIKE